MRKVFPGIFLLGIFLVVCLFVPFSRYCHSREGGGKGMILVSEYDGGELYVTSGREFHVLKLRGDFLRMGRQYGYLASDLLAQYYGEVNFDLDSRGVNHAEWLDEGKRWLGSSGREYQDIILGMAETSSLTYDEHVKLNSANIMLSNYSGIQVGCTGIAAWGRYSPGGEMVFGRNWDFSRDLYAKYSKYLSVVVYHPDDGRFAAAVIHPLGDVNCETGMNSAGLFLELNNGQYSDPTENKEGMNPTSPIFSALLSCSSLDETEEVFKRVSISEAYIIQAATVESACSFEYPTWGVRRREERENPDLVIAVNSFIPPFPAYPLQWQSVPAPKLEDKRRENLLALLNSDRFKGKMDREKMKELLEIPYEKGGTTFESTIYQVVAVPGFRMIEMKAPGYSEWVEIDLSELFR